MTSADVTPRTVAITSAGSVPTLLARRDTSR
jgi:hypothetical protein